MREDAAWEESRRGYRESTSEDEAAWLYSMGYQEAKENSVTSARFEKITFEVTSCENRRISRHLWHLAADRHGVTEWKAE